MRDFCKRHNGKKNQCGCDQSDEKITDREMRRGDTLVVLFQVVRDITTGQLFTVAQLGFKAPVFPPNVVPFDLTFCTIWMTVKKSTVDPDSQAISQLDNASIGGVTVSNYAQGQGAAAMPSQATLGFPDGVVELVYDIQIKDSVGNISTVEDGTVLVSPDVTRALLPIIPTPVPAISALNVTNWYIDGLNGSDSNNGVSPSTPVKTAKAIVSKWGRNDPDLPQNVTINVLRGQTLGAEQTTLKPNFPNGHGLRILGTPLFLATKSLGAVTAKNRATGVLLQCAGFTGFNANQNLLVINNTRGGSRAIVRNVAGDVATLWQPLSPMTYGTDSAYFPQPPLHDDWALNDNISIYQLPLLNIVDIACTGPVSDPLETTGAVCWLENLYIPDQSGTTGASCFSPEYEGGYMLLINCIVDAFGLTTTSTYFNASVGTWWRGGIQSQNTYFTGGAVSFSAQYLHFTWFDGSFVIDTASAVNAIALFGDVCINAGASIIIHPGTSIEIRQNVYAATGVLWGQGSLSLQSAATVVRRTPTTSWATCLLLTGTLHFPSNATTGTSYAAGVFTDGRPLNVTNLDTFHGLQDPKTGARFCEDL